MSLCWLSSFVLFVFFFKQKTAYEMRISDWSSDVCSSDLSLQRPAFAQRRAMVPAPPASRSIPRYRGRAQGQDYMSIHRPRHLWSSAPACRLQSLKRDRALVLDVAEVIKLLRSEEHTSELQSLMRISYAVFCLKKKKNRQDKQ